MCRGLHFFCQGKKLSIRDRICLYITAVKRAEIVNDRMSHIVMRVGRCDLALTVACTNCE